MSIFSRLRNNNNKQNREQEQDPRVQNKAYALYMQEHDGYGDFLEYIEYNGKTNYIEFKMEFTEYNYGPLYLKPPAYVKGLEEPYSEQEIEQVKKRIGEIFYDAFLHEWYGTLYNIGDEGVVWANGVYGAVKDDKILPAKIEFINNYRDVLATFSNFPVLVLCDKDVASMYMQDDEYSDGNLLECTDGNTYNFRQF